MKTLTLFIPTGGFFEKVHPAVKFICLFLSFVAPFFSNHPLHVLPIFIILIGTAVFSGAWPNVKRFWPLMFILFFMSALLWTFFRPGQTVMFTIGPVAFMEEAVIYGLTTGLRLACFMVSAIIFLTSTPIEDFTYGLSKLGMPFVASFTITLAFRLTPLFMETGQTIVLAQKSRGLDIDSAGMFKKIRLYVPIIIPILVSGLRRADQMAIALESKGFGMGGKKTVLIDYRLGWRDGLLVTTIIFISTACWFYYDFITF